MEAVGPVEKVIGSSAMLAFRAAWAAAPEAAMADASGPDEGARSEPALGSGAGAGVGSAVDVSPVLPSCCTTKVCSEPYVMTRMRGNLCHC